MTGNTGIPTHPSNRVNLQSLGEMFRYHPPTDGQVAAYGKIRSAAMAFAAAIYEHCPPCVDTSAAVRRLREAVMTANAAIALDPR